MKSSYLFIALIILLIPTSAFAWGPGTHLNFALHALENLSLLPAATQTLLKTYPQIYLYGTIAADIIFGKKFAGELYHCHHWDVALSLYERAKTESQKVFILGYLSHLSVDTIAHNYYVPYKTISAYQNLALGHAYWEIRFDDKMPAKVWKQLQALSASDFLELDEFLQSSLKRTLFSFATNKKIFNSMMLVSRIKKWRQAAALLSKRNPQALSQSEVDMLSGLGKTVLIEFLQDPENARVRRADPSGNLKLRYAKEMIRDLRRYTRRRIISRQKAEQLIHRAQAALFEGIYQPVDLPLITDAIS